MNKLFVSISFSIFILLLLAGVASAATCGGNIACSCGDLIDSSRIMNSSDSLTGCSGSQALLVNGSNITIDCNGYTVSGTASDGISLISALIQNITIKNCIIHGFSSKGIFLDGASNTIINNVIYDTGIGIYVGDPLQNITNNTIYDNGQGIFFDYSGDNTTVYDNRIYDNTQEGVYNLGANYVIIDNNNISSNTDSGVYVDSCFLAGTRILMADSTYKDIEDVEIGDYVKSYDEGTGELTIGRVLNTFYHEKTSGYLIINNNLKLTTNHPMYVNKEWKLAGEIKEGDLLLDKDGNRIVVTSIEYVDEIVSTYNLKVAGHHNYYANDILTHNKCPRIFTHNGDDYEFDLLINVAQFGKENDNFYSYPVKHLNEPKILMEYEPSEINYVDFIKIKIVDKAAQPELEDKTYILDPISCVAETGCELSDIASKDGKYLILDDNRVEYYIEFEEIPKLEIGYEREIEMLSSGYQIRINNDFDYFSNPDYILDFMREYEESGRGNSFNTITNNIIHNNGADSSDSGILLANAESHSTIRNNDLRGNYKGISLGSSINVTIENNTIINSQSNGLYFANIGANITVFHNDIYNNGGYQIVSSKALEVSNGSEGNYWGRTNCPSFIPGADSNASNIVDSYSYNSSYAWLTGASPSACTGGYCGGNITCNCGDFLTSSRTLNASDNLVNCASGLNITLPNILLDCNGINIIGVNTNKAIGIYKPASNVTIKNCIISNFSTLIFSNASHTNVINNTLLDAYYGVEIYKTANFTIINNTINTSRASADGVYVIDSSNGNITRNTITDNHRGIHLWTTGAPLSNIKIWHNNLYNSNGAAVWTNFAIEASYNQQGNFWGHNSCPLFTQGIDSFDNYQTDNYPYNASNAWDQGGVPKICCGYILSSSHTLTEDLQASGFCFQISAPNAVLDCNGFRINGSNTGNAIQIYKPASNVTVKNCIISNFSTLIFSNASHTNVINNTLLDAYYGVEIYKTANFTIINNTINTSRASADGVYVIDSSNGNITRNTITDNHRGIHLWTTGAPLSNIKIWHNNLYNSNGAAIWTNFPIEASYNNQGNYWGHNSCPLFTHGIDSFDNYQNDSYPYNASNAWDFGGVPVVCPVVCGQNIYSSTTLTNNLIGCPYNGLDIKSSDVVLDCDGYTISGSGSGYGIDMFNVDRVTVKNCVIHGFRYSGIRGRMTKNLSIINNSIYNITDANSELISVSGNQTIFANANITGNNLTGGDAGIFCSYSTTDTINNDIQGQRYCIENGFACGTAKIIGNRISGCTQAGALLSASHNVTGNSITGSYYGLWTSGSPKIYHNNIYNNALNINSGTALEVSYNGQGNYWGRSSCPSFVPGNDSNLLTVTDKYPYSALSAWLIGGTPNTCPPIIQLITPANGQTVLSSNTNFTFYASNYHPVTTLGYNLTLNGQFNQTGNFTNGTNASVSVSGFANGTNFWNVTVWDYVETANTSQTNSFDTLIQVIVETVSVPPIINTTSSSGYIDLATKGVPQSFINETGVIGYEYIVTTNGSTPTVNLEVQIFIEPGPANVSDISGVSGAATGFYYKINVSDPTWYQNVTNIQLKIYYNFTNLNLPAGVTEDSLRPVRYTSGSWVRLDCSGLGGCIATLADGTKLFAAGADTTNKFVWANLSRFSSYGISGAGAAATTSTGAYGSGGGSGSASRQTYADTTVQDDVPLAPPTKFVRSKPIGEEEQDVLPEEQEISAELPAPEEEVPEEILTEEEAYEKLEMDATIASAVILLVMVLIVTLLVISKRRKKENSTERN